VSDRETAYRERCVLHDDPLELRSNLLPHTPVLTDAFMHAEGGIDGKVIVMAQAPHRPDVVGVVMGDDDSEGREKGETIALEILFERPHAHSRIYHERLCISVEQAAVAAAPTAERYEM
jgi:hypothetical protein